MNKEGMRRERVRWNLILNPGRGEFPVCQALHRHKINFQRQMEIGPYFVDIGIPHLQLVVEIDHAGKMRPRGRASRNAARQAFIESQGWTVLRVESRYAENNPDDVVGLILETGEQP